MGWWLRGVSFEVWEVGNRGGGGTFGGGDVVAEVLFVFDALVDDAVGEEEEVGGEGEGPGAGDCCVGEGSQ